MLENDFEIPQPQNFFDIRAFFSRILGYWWVILLCLGIAFAIAYYLNLRAARSYRVTT